MLIPVILAGGVGSRLWPLSRDLYPKQLLTLIGESTLLQATANRALQIAGVKDIIVICSQQYQFLVEEQLAVISATHRVNFHIILEPVGRNTAPALAIAALQAQQWGDPFLLVLPADHVIGDDAYFANEVQYAAKNAPDKMITFGIKPLYPETGYGYIEAAADEISHIRTIKQFVEKPDSQTATHYCNTGHHYWNSGIFLGRAAVCLMELQNYAPNVMMAAEQAWHKRVEFKQFMRIEVNDYAACPNISIDFAVMEKTQIGVMLPLDAVWSDVGSWLAVSQLEAADEQGNVCIGDVFTAATKNCYLRSESRLLTVIGAENQIIVETADAVLVVDKSRAQHVKQVVEQLKSQCRKEAESHSVLFQPWGHYEVICEGHGFNVKQISMKPGAKLTAVTPENTYEHWVVLHGTADITLAEQKIVLGANQFIDVLPQQHYEITSKNDVPLKLLNIQTSELVAVADNKNLATDTITKPISVLVPSYEQ